MNRGTDRLSYWITTASLRLRLNTSKPRALAGAMRDDALDTGNVSGELS
jgi:hypothetical protein